MLAVNKNSGIPLHAAPLSIELGLFFVVGIYDRCG